jgi:nitrile hydratase subunit alpha
MNELSPAQHTEALEQRLHSHGHVDPERVSAAIAAAESASGDRPSTALGAKVVARAWVDADFRDRLISDPVNTLAEYHPQAVPIAVLVDTPSVHHVIVCTLCSCYPVSLLGPSPGWYKSFAYRSRTVREPRGVLAEFGLTLPPGAEITVWDSTSEARYMVLPARPAGTDELSGDDLAALVTRNGLIGTALV